MRITALTILFGSGLAGCAHEMPHQEAPHHEAAPSADHHERAAPLSGHHNVPAHHAIDVVTEPVGGVRFRAHGSAIRRTHH